MTKVSTTKRTLHYYWLATKKHFGLFALVIGSTIGFSGFLTYRNPYVMSKIIEDGPHAELVQQSGEYASLWNRQTGAYEG